MPRQNLNDITLHYDTYVSKAAKPAGIILLLHGLGSSTLDWSEQVPALTPIYTVLLIDLRGHGQSDKPPGPYSINQMASDVANLCKHLGLSDLHVVGLSMGAQVALQLALDYSPLVRTITVVNSPADMTPRRIRDRWSVLQRKLLVSVLGMRKIGEVIASRLLPGDEFADRRRLFAERWAKNDPAAYRASFNAILEWDITSDLSSISQPMLIVAARLDYTPLEWKQRVVDLAADASLVIIENSRHATPVDSADQFNQVLLDFLSHHQQQ